MRLNVALLFWVLWQATGYPGRSLMVAALFALHPINVESVAWVAERKNLLSMLFFLLALGAYRWYARQPRVGRYAAVTLLYVLGLMSKPQVITLPFVLLLWDYWPLRRMAVRDQESADATEAAAIFPQRSFSWLVKEKLPLFALSAASAVITMRAQRLGAGSIQTARSSSAWRTPSFLTRDTWDRHFGRPVSRPSIPFLQVRSKRGRSRRQRCSS